MNPEDVAACWEANAETWTRLVRAGHDRYRDALNTPAFLALLPSVAGLAGLDIGCGEGANTRALARLGARMTGIDVAPTFVRHAEEAEAAEPLGVAYRVADAAALPFADASFSFATAFMSLMDMPDQPAALTEAHRVLAPGGFLQFSILHPCFVPPRHRNVRDAEGRVVALEIGGYFEETDGEIETWMFSTVPPGERGAIPPFRVPRYHRTLSRWVEMVVGAGFLIEAMAEPRATEEEAAAEPVVADTRVAPIFLQVRCRKAG
jgi:ubiquinone/menaquinone biosynthesis C-methylase UbiE